MCLPVKLNPAEASDGSDELQQSSQIWYGARALAGWIGAGGSPRRHIRAHALRLRWHAHWFEQNWQAQARRLETLAPPKAPVFILGLWRSGTTVLHELLAACTGWTTPRTWQCFRPSTCFLAGPPSEQAVVARPMDAGTISTHGPQEDEFALLLLGEPSAYRGFIDPRRLPECAALLSQSALSQSALSQPALSQPAESAALARWQLFVRGIAAQSADHHLLLKSPNHSFRLPLLSTLFPDAKFIWIGRQIGEVLASNLRMWRAMVELYALWDCPSGAIEGFLQEAVRVCAQALARSLEELQPEQLRWVDFEQLRLDPRGTLERTLEFLGADGTVGVQRLDQALAQIPIHAGRRETLTADEDAQRLEKLMAGARQRFGAVSAGGRRSLGG